MIVVAVILLGSSYEHFSYGIAVFLAKISAIDPSLTSFTNPKSFLFRDYFEIIFCQLVVGVAIVCQPHILTKSLLLKSEKDTNKFLTIVTLVMILFFMVIFSGFYARLAFPTMSFNNTPIRPDGLLSAYVVSKFSVYVALVVILGLLSAGISTLEGLIQSVSSTITSDILRPLFGKYYPTEKNKRGRVEMNLNRLVIAILAVITIFMSYEQLVNPKLSVIILAQNGVYIFFAAAFIPVLVGTYSKTKNILPAALASLTAIVVHLGVYYGELSSYYHNVPVKNPAIASSYAIISSIVVGFIALFITNKFKSVEQETLNSNYNYSKEQM